MRALWTLLAGCRVSETSEPSTSDPCLTAAGFEGCFEAAWCDAWSACGFTEPCSETRPWLTHYESNNGTMSIDCEDIEEPQYAACLALPAEASCEELYDAAQLDATNGPWIDLCITESCV